MGTSSSSHTTRVTRPSTRTTARTAGAPQIPRPLVEQLAPGGRLVLPMGDDELQTLIRLRCGPEGLVEEYLGECRFVKLLGSYGWEET